MRPPQHTGTMDNQTSVNQLRRPFKIIAFDWDGTAVMSRQDDATPVRQRLERLLQLGVLVVVISGTNFDNIDRQLSAAIVGSHKTRLYICTNRGSEVFGFDARSRPVLLWKRVATPLENRLLTDIADTVRQTIQSRTGLDIKVIYNRLNRRKIDLIPLPEWKDPPKSHIGDLLAAVQSRLIGAGLTGGLREAFDIAVQVAREKGLQDARITTDAKHLEIGLTDKGDSIEWTMSKLARKLEIAPREVLIAGDEFGPIAGIEGSDHKMVVPSAAGAVFTSVGVEPEGVPRDVIHLPGGPARFCALLDEQIAVHEAQAGPGGAAAPAPAGIVSSQDQGWLLVEEGFNPAREHEIESLFTVANGYLGTRGSLAEFTPVSRPATFISGLFHRSEDWIPELVEAPDWAQIRVSAAGEELRLDEGRILEHRRILDLRRGVLLREWRHCAPSGRITYLTFFRFVSLADRHALVESVTVVPVNYSGVVAVDSIVDARVRDTADKQLIPVRGDGAVKEARGRSIESAPSYSVLAMCVVGAEKTLAYALATTISSGEAITPKYRVFEEPERVTQRWEWEAEIGKAYRVDKFVSAYTSREVSDPSAAARHHAARLVEFGAEALLEAHAAEWARRWEVADVKISGDEEAQRAVRFAIYHLIATANPEDDRTSVGARGLTGEAYKGHVFWDTDIYMLPFYTYTHPPTARALEMYRYHTLPAARKKALALGYRGALYAWEAADTGEEATPPYVLGLNGEVIHILSGELQHHISADVAYGVWQYWRATGDDAFFRNAGAEIILETARFWASRVSLEKDGCYHIRNVIGPDEYHEGVDDDVYTNGMARWNLDRGVETVGVLKRRWPAQWSALAERLQLEPEEPDRWSTIARAMYMGFNARTRLFEQFSGYFDLDYVDLRAHEPRTAPFDVILGRERIARTQVIKQPDVLMLIFLLWEDFEPAVREANFRYYEPRTGHGSSLSPSIHALLAARLGDLNTAERYFRQAAEIDLANNMGNASLGVHIGAQGGLWQAAVLGFGGMRPTRRGSNEDEILAFSPSVPGGWKDLRFSVLHRAKKLSLDIIGEKQSVKMGLRSDAPIHVALGENHHVEEVSRATKWYVARRKEAVWHSLPGELE